MKNHLVSSFTCALLFSAALFFSPGCIQKNSIEIDSEEEHDGYDGPAERIALEIERTKDPATGKVPWDKLRLAIQETKAAKEITLNTPLRISALSWEERGPISDIAGPSNGNTRANNGIPSGRIRTAMVDSLDPTHKTVFVGGVAGGLWKTTDITTAPANWILVNDFLSNLAVSDICQDPRPGFQHTMYFCTGESYGNFDAVLGVGVFKSTDGGANWNFLSSSSPYTACTRILCDYEGNIYLATRGNGLLRSTDGGSSWTNITPSGVSANICDLEITSTAAPARLHMVTGISSTQTYRYTDIPATVTNASGWNAPTTAFPSYAKRAEIAVSGNTLFACPVDGENEVPIIYKSSDGGDNWSATASQPTSGWASGQGWYSLSAAINPANPDECIVGGLDCYKTTNGGNNWVKISEWVGLGGQYVHADQHDLQWYDGGTKLIFACDGGIHYSANGGTTIRDRNVGLRLKQFYSVAIHPTTTNYFLGGTQDNGTHQLTNAGLGSSIEVTGGDGAFVAIDQNESQYQFGAYVYNRYRRSTNGGASWSSINFRTGTSASPGDIGRFINPYEYDNTANIIYATGSTGNYFRLSDPQTVSSGTYYQTSPGWPSTAQLVSIGQFSGQRVSAIHVSPYTANRVYFGTGNGRLVIVDNADGTTPVETNITPVGASGFLNCIVTGSSDQNLIACYSNYNIMNVWVSTNGGTTWTGIDGNLPNMPVRWALFHPDSDTRAFIATETGVWETDLINGSGTSWSSSSTFPNVRTDMIRYRSSDRTIAAATHGRGIWTTTVPVPGGFTFTNPSPVTATCPAPNTMDVVLGTNASGGFTNTITLSSNTPPAGTSVSFIPGNTVTPGNNVTVRLTGTNTLATGSYVLTITGTAAGSATQTRNITYTINPGSGPVITLQPVNQTICSGGNTLFSITSLTATGYQWQVSTDGGSTFNNVINGSSYSGATTATLNISNAAIALNNYRYRCNASSQCGTTNSDEAILTINTAPTITSQPTSTSLCAGSNNTFSITAAGTGISYQWQLNVSGTGCAGPWTDIIGATSSSYTLTGITAAQNNSSYRCVVTGGCSPSAISDCAILSVGTPVTINSQPTSQTVCEGSNSAFTVTGNGTGIIYQWQLSTDDGTTWNNITGANSASIIFPAVSVSMNNYSYRCLLSNSLCTTPVISNAAVLTVNTLPFISAQPADVTLCEGSSNTFGISATGTGITYQWQVSTDGGTNWSNINGAISSDYSVTAVTSGMNNNRYRCVVSGTCSPAVVSVAGVLTVISPVIITSHPDNKENCSGSTISFTVAGNSTQPIIYQWQVSTNNGSTWSDIVGATADVYSLNGIITVMNNNYYRCKLSNATCTAQTFSNAAILTVRQTPTVGLSALPLTSLQPGQSTTLTATPVVTTDGIISTSWTFNTSPLAVSGNSYGVNIENAGAYQVKIEETWLSGLFCSALSPVVTIDAPVSDKLFVFPTPNDGRFTVSYYNNGGASTQRTIIIFSSKGEQVYYRKFGVVGAYTLLDIDLRTANTGIYYIVVGDAGGKKMAEGKVHVR